MLKCFGGQVVMAEVPDEISLAINISGCIHHCEGCHSPELQKDVGYPLLENLPKILKQYKTYISCICLMGGDQDQNELLTICKQIHEKGIKTCLYSGYDKPEQINKDLKDELDYLKIGHYDKNFGPLNVETTNQRMYMKTQDKHWIDITDKFWRKIYDNE